MSKTAPCYLQEEWGELISQIPQRERDMLREPLRTRSREQPLGRRGRGKQIVKEFGASFSYNDMKATMNLQFHDVENFVHEDFKGNKNIRYI